MAPVLNEEQKIGEVVRRVPRDVVDHVLVIDDGCTDASPQVAAAAGAWLQRSFPAELPAAR